MKANKSMRRKRPSLYLEPLPLLRDSETQTTQVRCKLSSTKTTSLKSKEKTTKASPKKMTTESLARQVVSKSPNTTTQTNNTPKTTSNSNNNSNMHPINSNRCNIKTLVVNCLSRSRIYMIIPMASKVTKAHQTSLANFQCPNTKTE